MPALSTPSHTHMLPHAAERGFFTVSFVIKSMKIAHLDNPSLSALSARKTLTHPMHSFPHYHTAVIFESADYKATCFLFSRAPGPLLVSSLAKPGVTWHTTKATHTKKKAKPSRTGWQSRTRKTVHKRFLFGCPLEESGPGDHLIHFFLRAINLFKHQNHFASQEREMRLSFLLQSTRGSVAQWDGGQWRHCPCSCFSHLKQKQGREYIITSVR